MTEPLDENARAWLKSSDEMDSDYANQVDEYIDALEAEVEKSNKIISKIREIVSGDSNASAGRV